MRLLGMPRIAGLLAVFTIVLSACAPTMAGYSLDAYKNATSLKAETLALVDDSGKPYADKQAEERALSVKLQAAYEFSAGTPKNLASAAQWKTLLGPDLYGNFVNRWKDAGPGGNSEAFRQEMKIQLGEAFDMITCLEVNKQKSQACSKSATEAAQ